MKAKQKTLREYIAELQSLAILVPEALDLPVYYAQDDGGNYHHEMYQFHRPMFGRYEEGDFDTEAEGPDINGVVINA